MALYAHADQSLINVLGVSNQSFHVPKSLQETILKKIIPAVNNPENINFFSTFWTIIDRDSNCMVGDLCFKGNPNELGELEIGYGTHADFQNKGFMTEAVGGIISWAFEQENVNCIWAETDPKNLASQKVLIKNKFEQIDATSDYIYWRKNKK